jgi:hypothetical protein
MANVLSLALRVTADASQLKLDPVQRALVGLGDQADKLSGQFAKFSGDSDAAAKAQERFAKQAEGLINTLRDGGSATDFAAGFEKLTEAANKEAAAFERAARIIEANLSPLERFDRAQAELKQQVDAGRISLDTYNRATENAAKGLTDAERAARGLAVQQKEIDTAAASTTLKFNELSGVFAILPGPLGNIAGRISGIASASEGLSRIFAGGLQAGFQGLVSSVTALINPFTLALAGITAFAAGAAAVVRGLIALEDRVENLGNTADKLGVSFEFIQTLEEAANRSGTSIDAVSAAFGRLQKSVLGVDEESKAAQKALAEIGVTAEELAALSPEEQYQRIGRALADIEDPARRTATATALFGKAGADLIPFFNNIGPAADDIERYGRALSDLDRGNIDSFGASLDALSVATQGFGQAILLPFAGLGDGIARGLAEVTAGITAVIDPIGRVLTPVLDQIGRVVESLGIALGNIGRVIGAVFEPFAVVVEEVYSALKPLFDLFLDLQRTLGDAAVAAVEWVMSFTPIGAIAENIAAFGQTISRVVTIIVTAFQRAGQAISAVVSNLVELASQSPILQTLGGILSAVFNAVASVISSIVNAVGAFINQLLTIAEYFLGIDTSASQAAEATDTLGASVEELTEEERKSAAEREKFLQGFTDNVSKAIDESAKFGQAGFDAALQYQNAITDLQDRLDRGLINEEVFRREAAAAEAAYDDQIKIAEKAAAQIEANTKRVDDLIAKANEIPQIEQELNAVESEISRVQTALAAARENGATEQANALAARLSQLDQLQAGLQDQADQAAQGFSQGFDSAFANVDKGINSLIDKASEFGNEGALAASQLQEGIAAAQEQVRDGILNREAFEAEVERQKKLFESRVKDLQQAEKIAQDIAKKQEALRDREFEIQQAREEELAGIRTGSVKINDLRSGGISAFFDTLKEDPAIAEAKAQTKELQAMRKEIAKLNAEKVDILAGTG